MDTHSKERIQMLAQSAKNQNPAIRAKAVELLGRTGVSLQWELARLPVREAASDAVPIDQSELIVAALIDAARDTDLSVRTCAVGALSVIGMLAKPAAPVMLEKLTDENEAIRVSAARSIGYLAGDPAQAIPTLTAALKDPSAMVRINAATSLAQFGAGAREAVPVLLGLLRSSDEELKFTLPAGESQPPGWNERLEPRSTIRALGRFASQNKKYYQY